MPSTFPDPMIGVDQQAASPSGSAWLLNSAQNGWVAMSVTVTGLPVNAAVPHEPTPGPIAVPSRAAA